MEKTCCIKIFDTLMGVLFFCVVADKNGKDTTKSRNYDRPDKMAASTKPAIVDDRPEINYPLVELTRPAIYRSLKYWGKKPHNIWAQYIERYCPEGGTIADPFAGSAVAAFEAVKLGRKAIAFDLNPLSSFIIETTASKWIRNKFLIAAGKIRTSVSSDAVYITHFKRSGGTATVLNYRWEKERIVSVGIESATGVRELRDADSQDINLPLI